MPTLVLTMAKTGPGGRPTKDEGEKTSDQVRIAADLREMIRWIVRLDPKVRSAADLLDPLIRGPIETRYKPLAKRAEEISRLESAGEAQGE